MRLAIGCGGRQRQVRFCLAGKCRVKTTMPGSCPRATPTRGARYNHQRVSVSLATRQIGMAAVSTQDGSAGLVAVAVAAANIDPLQSIWCPHPAPATVVGGVGVRHADKSKAVEAVMEEAVMEAGAESGRCKS